MRVNSFEWGRRPRRSDDQGAKIVFFPIFIGADALDGAVLCLVGHSRMALWRV
jgi:hypothetical protein